MKKNIFVTKSLLPCYEDYISEIKDLWDSHMLTNMGLKHQELEEKLSQYLKVPKMELIVNGHLSLEIALQSLELSGEVITSPFTFISTTHAIVRSGLTPMFCDINPEDLTIDVRQIESLITERTCAIMPIHVYGNVCDVETIEKIAKKHNLKVIYDAAHAFGVEIEGQGIGSFGDLSCFSFHATKVFNTIEGGGICVNDENLVEKIQGIRNFGMFQGEVVDVGGNGKMNEFSAAMGLCNLKLMEKATQARKKIVTQYQESLKETGIRFLTPQEKVTANYAYFPIFIDEKKYGFTREKVYQELMKENIIVRKYFYPITSKMPCYQGKYENETPVAEQRSKEVLCLPLYPSLEENTISHICEIIKNL